jgi:voltage-gated potassium channel
LLTAFGGGAAFASVEKNVDEWDGMWWAVTTMTTVGYGDVYPHTDSGRAIAIVLMVVGIGFVAVLTAAIAERFVAAEVHAEAATVEQEVADELQDARADALAELAAIAERLRRVEAAVHQLGRMA